MSVHLTPSKRSYDEGFAESNGRGKWQKSASFSSRNTPSESSITTSFLRVLFPASRVADVIGDDDNVISQMCEETGALIKVEELILGCEERVILISSDRENKASTKEGSAEENDSKAKDEDIIPVDKSEQAESDEARQHVSVEDSKSEEEASSVQKALLLLFERMTEGEQGVEGGDEESNKSSSSFNMRLLVLSNQVGCLLGKGGGVIKQMSSESGAQIRILPRDKLPLCASSSDELVQISGESEAVRKALRSISVRLFDRSSYFRGSPSQSYGHPFPRQDSYLQRDHASHGQGAPHSAGTRDEEHGLPSRFNPSQNFLTFRLLCHDEKVGSIIGKGGSVIKAFQHETGCDIKVMDRVADSEDRVIIISGPAFPDERISAPQDAVLRIQARIFRSAPENKEKNLLAKLLVSSNQIGCLLGKGGAIIAEMRKSTGAYIRILGKDQVPKCALENEEVIQMNGEFEVVQEALLQITARLRNHFFRDMFPSSNHPSNPAFMDQMPPFPFRGRREFSPPGMFPNIGPSFHKFDDIDGLHPRGGFHAHDDLPPFMHSFHRPGMPPHISERMSSSAPWAPQGPVEGGRPLGMPDYAGGPQRRPGGFGGGSHPAIITSTTVEVVVPRSAVPSIYGEDGGCLRQIHEISEAKVTITDPKPGATETVIIISGTPEQANAAQSLIQAFVISENEAP